MDIGANKMDFVGTLYWRYGNDTVHNKRSRKRPVLPAAEADEPGAGIRDVQLAKISLISWNEVARICHIIF
jgi:hypothetical protein